MKHSIPLFLLLLLLPGCRSEAGLVTPPYRSNSMQKSQNYLEKLRQVSSECSHIRIILRRFGKEPVIIPLSQENQAGIRTLITHMLPVNGDIRMKPRASYSARLQFLDANENILLECDTSAVGNGKEHSHCHLALSEEELRLWKRYVRRDDIINLIRQQ